MSEKKFGLIIPKRPDKFKMRANSIFDNDDSDEDEKQRKRPKIPQKKIDIKSKLKKESQEDPSIYEYDSIYDDMKAKQTESIAPKEKKSSRYIDTLLKAADKRKKQYERRIDKKIQAEREKEGDLYKDKEAFVTSSYKKKLLEKEEEEERERRENMLNDMMDITKQKDLSGFYRHFLKQTVGEEKIPTFGEKHIKQESTASKETNSPSRSEKASISENIKDVNLDQTNIDQDSDGINIDSDSDDKSSKTSGESCSRKHTYQNSIKYYDSEEKIHKSKSKKHSVSKGKSRFFSQEKDQKTCQNNSNISNSDSEPSNDEDVRYTEKVSPSDAHGSKKTNIHRHDSLSSDDAEGDKKSDEPKEQNKVVKKDKISIYTKRTVGDAFVTAQARYFQRISVKNEK